MKKIVLLRHGESVWNRENRFTGWTDVDLSEKGVAEAVKAGETLRKEGFHFGRAYTSYLKRAVKTLDVVLDRMDRDWIPVTKTWRLNEKHYGMLQGLNKRDTAEKYGDEQVYVWRRSYDVAPANQKHIQRYLSDNCFGDFLTRGGLDVKMRELLTFSMLVSLGGCESQVKGHIAGNANIGNDKATLLAVVTQLLPYIGYPRTLNGIACLNEVLPEK